MPPRGPMRGPAKPKNAKGALSRLMRLLGPYRFRLLLVSFCILVSTGVSTYGAYLLRDVTNDYILPLRAEYVASGTMPALDGLFRMLALMLLMYLTGAFSTLLYNRLYAAYCTTDGALRPSDKDLLALAEEHSLMTADVLFISTAELDDAAKADAKALMGDYARQLSAADDKAAAFAALEAGENVTVLASNTYDGCDETTLNTALAALAEDQVSDVIEDETGYYVALRRAVDLNAVAEMAFGEDLSARISGAQVEHNDSVYNAINLTSFYARYTAGQQKLYAQLTAEQPQG